MKTTEQRFWEKVKITEGCWEWTANRLKAGYGCFCVVTKKHAEKTDLAHRVSWRLHFGEIPEGMFVLHKCDNPSCVCPDHLFLGTPKDNMDDKKQKNRERHKAKITFERVIELREVRRKTGMAYVKLGRLFGISGPHAYAICANKFRTRNIESVL